MSTLSGNIAGTIRPFMPVQRDAWPYGGGMAALVSVDDLKKKRRKKRESTEGLDLDEAVKRAKKRAKSKKVGDDEYELNGKRGRWRNVQGGPVFFPSGGGKPVGLHPSVNRDKTAKGKSEPKAKSAGGGGGSHGGEPKGDGRWRRQKSASGKGKPSGGGGAPVPKKKPTKTDGSKGFGTAASGGGGGGGDVTPEGAGIFKRIFGKIKDMIKSKLGGGGGSPETDSKTPKSNSAGKKKTAGKKKSSAKSNQTDVDFNSKSVKKLERGLKATAAKMQRLKKRGGDLPKGSERAVSELINAIKSRDAGEFARAQKSLSGAAFD